MFEGIDLYEIKYSPHGLQNSFAGVEVESQALAHQEKLSVAQTFLKDCSFVLDGTSWVSQFFPVSPMAQSQLLYIQSFSYWEAKENYYTERKNLDSYLLVYTYDGCGELQYNGKTYRLEKNSVFFIDCKELHLYKTIQAPWKHSVLHFNGIPSLSIYKDFLLQNNVSFSSDTNMNYQWLLENLLKAYTSISPYREYQVSSYLMNLLLAVLTNNDDYQKAQENMPIQVKDIVYYLNRNYAKDISLDHLSFSFSISKYHLCHSFKKYTGFTINEYVAQLRLDKAKELLRTTNLPANQIGASIGILDENYFYRFFRKQTGISPHKYRKG